MLPVQFDHKMLSSLPLLSEEGFARVQSVLGDVMNQRVFPYFRIKRGIDPIRLAQARQGFSIYRLEDEGERIGLVSMLTRGKRGWSIGIHERIFDYMGFVIPLTPEQTLKERANEERKMLAFAAFLLRHDFEHIVYPDHREREVIGYDVEYAMLLRSEDPIGYSMLRSALRDEMNGIAGERYSALLDLAEQGKPSECAVMRILHTYGASLGEVPEAMLEDLFPYLDSVVLDKIIGDHYRCSSDESRSLAQRAESFRKLFHLFSLLCRENEQEAFRAFHTFHSRWGVAALFHELGLRETGADGDDIDGAFEVFREAMEEIDEHRRRTSQPDSSSPGIRAAEAGAAFETKSVQERIEEARSNPHFPQQALEIIDKNGKNAAGQSGSKYSELIETLLSIPWGKFQNIAVSSKEFEEGLDRTHYGLLGAKEIICDIFSNLIWRYQHLAGGGETAWRHTGAAILLVGAPGVGKTSLAISIARSLGIPYHKVSLAGMRDEADIRGHGFTYEGSKPGSIVQGLIKMGVMNGMFIMDEVDKSEKFAISTLLEILDPEQNHLFHDKYTQTTVDIDLSNCHFILTANTLDTVPEPVADRCEVIILDRYSLEEKITIAQRYLVGRVREKYMISEDAIYFDPSEESEIFRYMIAQFTSEAGLREFERILRTLFLRLHRKEIMGEGRRSIRITHDRVNRYLGEMRPAQNTDEADEHLVGARSLRRQSAEVV